jgi:N-methylhydantoinase A
MCYGRGGKQPTVTDALLMLGILSADAEFAGGSFSLNKTGVAEAFAVLGEQMGYGAEDAAFDCWRVVNANMIQAVRRTTAGKGVDSKDLVMLAYGGNGPAFAAVHADALGIEKVLVPKASPTFSALGTLVAKPSIDEERSFICPVDNPDLAKLKVLWKDLNDRATSYFTDAGFAPEQVTAKYQLNMRYRGQNWPLTFDMYAGKAAQQDMQKDVQDLSFVDATLSAKAFAAFNARHMEEFGHIREGERPEITGVRLSTSVDTPAPVIGSGSSAPRVAATVAKTRRANLGEGYQETNIYLGTDLQPGYEIAGPAIIEETFTTIVVYPGWKAHVDDAGDYELTRQ